MSYQVIFNFISPEEQEELFKLIDKLHWEKGRQETGYLKAAVPVNYSAIIQGLVVRSIQALDNTEPRALTYDCYILKYEKGSFIPYHKDDALFESQHWRLNAIISDADKGGELNFEHRTVGFTQRDAVIFRPDLLNHSVSTVESGIRYVWSVGILK